MMVELAPAALALAALLASALASFGITGFFATYGGVSSSFARRCTFAVFALVSLALGILLAAYAASDFSVSNVYENSHTAKPLLYKLTGAWGNHEGSMLLWLWMVTLFAAALALGSDSRLRTAALTVLGLMSAGFLFFILFTSNPFTRLETLPFEGKDLNPLLQDIGLALHPPLLYLGYVGFSAVFALTAGALLAGEDIGPRWARLVRPWALLSWGFLTLGIGLGSWWAYRELGWGGWWFWDPVENISLLPWLSGTALVHCLFVLSRRPVLQNWTLLLSLLSFALSLMGTFLVRSGLLTSVHSFASDPARGMYILLFSSLVIGGGLYLYALRYPRPSTPDFLPVSREGGVMANNLLLVTACATVFLGVLYPILLQVFHLPSVSVGAPYYNTVMIPLAMPLLVLAGAGPMLTWKRVSGKALRRMSGRAALWTLAGVAALVVLPSAAWQYLWAMKISILALLAGIWLVAATFSHALREWQAHQGRLPLSSMGMLLAHAGLGIFAVAAAFASAGRVEQEALLEIGKTYPMAGYEVHVASLERETVDNYVNTRATLRFIGLESSGGFTLRPESRFYPARGMETAESAIHTRLWGDVYTAISLPPKDAGHIILRLYIVPAALWLWIGFIFAGIGGMVAAIGHFRAVKTDVHPTT